MTDDAQPTLYIAHVHREEARWIITVDGIGTTSTTRIRQLHSAAHSLVADAAATYGVTAEQLLHVDQDEDGGRGEVLPGQAVTMQAAWINRHSLPAIASHFDRTNSEVLHATRRVQGRADLLAKAQQIAAQSEPAQDHVGADRTGSDRRQEPHNRRTAAHAADGAAVLGSESLSANETGILPAANSPTAPLRPSRALRVGYADGPPAHP